MHECITFKWKANIRYSDIVAENLAVQFYEYSDTTLTNPKYRKTVQLRNGIFGTQNSEAIVQRA